MEYCLSSEKKPYSLLLLVRPFLTYFLCRHLLQSFSQSWQFGWYADKAETYSATSGATTTYTLGGISTYGSSDNTVLVKVNTASSDDFYINFNRQSGFNSGTVEGGDQVMVIRQGNEGVGYAESELLAKLNANGVYTIAGTDPEVRVTVNSINLSANEAEITVTSTPPPPPLLAMAAMSASRLCPTITRARSRGS